MWNAVLFFDFTCISSLPFAGFSRPSLSLFFNLTCQLLLSSQYLFSICAFSLRCKDQFLHIQSIQYERYIVELVTLWRIGFKHEFAD
mmetsp:Transcript_75490/g.87747  ORF Transcript_75490/g.87747 Transcript_75490/m.87747 type:complete len:87 (+) Transcript_75490:1537-1797(+)